MASVSQFAGRRDGEASFRSAYGTTALAPPRTTRKWRQFRSSQAPLTGRLLSGLRMTRPRWASQEPANVAAIPQFAPLGDGEASFWSAYDTIPLGLPGAHERGDSFAIRSPHGRRGSILACVWHHSSHESTKVATVSQVAARRDGEVSF